MQLHGKKWICDKKLSCWVIGKVQVKPTNMRQWWLHWFQYPCWIFWSPCASPLIYLDLGLQMTAYLQYLSKIWLSTPGQFLIVLSQAIPAHFWIRYVMGSQDHIFYQNPLIQTNTALVMPLRNRKNDSNWDIVCFCVYAVIHLDALCQVRLRYLSYPPAPFKRYYMAS